MKKLFSLLLVVSMILSLCACGGSGKNELHLWEIASTDVVDFSIDDAKFTIYAREGYNSEYRLLPVDYKTAYAAPTGKTIVVISFSVKNNDRAATMSIGNQFGSTNDIALNLDWKIKYKGKEYNITGLDGEFDMSDSVTINRHTQEAYKDNSTINVLLDSESSASYRIAGIVDFEPDSLDDKFEIKVTVPDSKGKKIKATYSTEYNDKSREMLYNSGVKLMEMEEYHYAMEKFQLAGEYSDAKEKYNEAMLMFYLSSPLRDEASDYLKKNKDSYRLLKSDEIKNMIVGEWNASKHSVRKINFLENGVIENEYISDGIWKISGDHLEYMDHDKDTKKVCEVREIKDGIYVLYNNGTEPVLSLKAINK